MVEEHDLPFLADMEHEKEFNTNPADFEVLRSYNRFAKFKLIGETNNSRLGLANLIDNGLKGAPQGAVILSKKEYTEVLEYIEKNF